MSQIIDRIENYRLEIRELSRRLRQQRILMEQARSNLAHAGIDGTCRWDEDEPPGQFTCRDCGVDTCQCYDGADDPDQCTTCWAQSTQESSS